MAICLPDRHPTCPAQVGEGISTSLCVTPEWSHHHTVGRVWKHCALLCKICLERKNGDCIFFFLAKQVSLCSHSSALDRLRKLLVSGKSSYEKACSQLHNTISLLRIKFQNKIREALEDFLFLWSFLLKADTTSLWDASVTHVTWETWEAWDIFAFVPVARQKKGSFTTQQFYNCVIHNLFFTLCDRRLSFWKHHSCDFCWRYSCATLTTPEHWLSGRKATSVSDHPLDSL